MHRILKSIRVSSKRIGLFFLAVIFVILTGCSKEQETSELREVELEEEAEGTDLTKEQTDAEESAEEIPEDENREETADIPDSFFVHVCGEVVNPGVYTLPAGSRIYEAIEAAGGLTDQASGESLNQAAEIEDGQQIYVLSKEEAAQGMTVDGAGASGNLAGTDTGSQSGDDAKVSLNSASMEQLMTLSGIGEAKAAAIIQYREEHGGFQTLEELMEVDGIKEGTFNKIKDQIRL